MSHIPCEVDHGHDGLVPLGLVPLVPLDGGHVLAVGQGPRVPGHVVAPSRRLDPVDTARVDPDDLARPLHEPVAGDVELHQVGHLGPPAAVQVVHLVELALLLERPPVLVRDTEPLAVPGADVDVDSREVVVLLVSGCSGSGNLTLKIWSFKTIFWFHKECHSIFLFH